MKNACTFSTVSGEEDVESGDSGDEKAIMTDLLVIAGDFFDFWFERGGLIYPEFRPVVERLVQLRQSGIRISLCEGNHDFFLADYFSGELGIRSLSGGGGIRSGRPAYARLSRRYRGPGKPTISGVAEIPEEPLFLQAATAASAAISLADRPVQLGDEPGNVPGRAGETGGGDASIRRRKVSQRP